MLVEDQALIAMDTEEVLRLLGALNVRLIATTAEALAALAAETPDCVVLDFNLGDDTPEAVADQLMASGVPFVFATGYGDTVRIPHRFGGVPVVQKPISGPALAEQLGRVVPTRA